MSTIEYAFRAFSVICATFYLSYVIAHTGGPLGAFKYLRTPHRHIDLSGLLGCIYCLAPYIAVVMWVMAVSPYWAWSVDIFAVAGAALLLFRFTGGSHV